MDYCSMQHVARSLRNFGLIIGTKLEEMFRPRLFIISHEVFFLHFPLRVICRTVAKVSRLTHYAGLRDLINL